MRTRTNGVRLFSMKTLTSSSRTELFLGKPENEKLMMTVIPLGRGSSPRDVANVACFLASDEVSDFNVMSLYLRSPRLFSTVLSRYKLMVWYSNRQADYLTGVTVPCDGGRCV